MNSIESSTRELSDVKGNIKTQLRSIEEARSRYHNKGSEWCIYQSLIDPYLLMLGCKITDNDPVHQRNRLSTTFTGYVQVVTASIRCHLFQEPVKVEDDPGQVFSFASGCSRGALITRVSAQYKQQPGTDGGSGTQLLAGPCSVAC